MIFFYQASPGEALARDELQSGVDVANEIAESYQRCVCINDIGYVLCCSAVMLFIILHNVPVVVPVKLFFFVSALTLI